MTKPRPSPAKKSQNSSQPVVLFGTDENGKSRAARFSGAQSELAIKAAGLSNLHSHLIATSEVADIAAKLPTGRVYANGRGFVPYVRRDLYAKLLGAIGQPAEPTGPSSPPGLPQNWDEIAAGHLVLVQESLEEGWWECIVLARDGDMITCRARDYPKYAPFVIHLSTVALLKPTAPTS